MTLPEPRRRTLQTAALGAAVTATLVVATLFSRRVFEGPTRELPPRRPAHPAVVGDGAAPVFRVAALVGEVAVLHEGQWYVAMAGDQLTLQDVIRTPRGASALLRREGTEIEVRDNVDIRLDALANRTASFGVLRGGNVVASVEDDKDRLEITAVGTRSVNRGPARWVVSLGESGQVSVAPAKGEVAFAAQGKEVLVIAGHESTAPAGRPPGDPEPIPEELLLSVVWPELDKGEARAPIAGKVRPSSRVTVNGVAAPVHGDGSFGVAVPLGVGANAVEVQAEDIAGRKKAVSKVLRRPAPAPTLETSGEDLWKR
jgi:hypothetical protein